jgi:hypothetical protein
MWKWEGEYEEYLELQNRVQDHSSMGSRSMIRTYAVTEARGGRRESIRNESNQIQRQLMEIIWLLKVVIVVLGLVVCLLLVCGFKQM